MGKKGRSRRGRTSIDSNKSVSDVNEASNNPESDIESQVGENGVDDGSLSEILASLKRQEARSERQEKKIDELNNKFDDLTRSLGVTHSIAEENRTKIKALETENKKMKYEALTKEVQLLKQQKEATERRSREWGVRIHGVPCLPNENTRAVVSKIIAENKLNGIDNVRDADAEIEHCHRLPMRPTEGAAAKQRHPVIIINFYSRPVRNRILRDAKGTLNKSKSGVYMVEDMTREDYRLKKAAQPQMQAAYAANKKAMFKKGKLYINSQVVPIKFN